MPLDVALLPDDAAFLKALLVEIDADRNAHKLVAERLKIQLARLRRMQFGSSSEKIAREIEQLELALILGTLIDKVPNNRKGAGVSHHLGMLRCSPAAGAYASCAWSTTIRASAWRWWPSRRCPARVSLAS